MPEDSHSAQAGSGGESPGARAEDKGLLAAALKLAKHSVDEVVLIGIGSLIHHISAKLMNARKEDSKAAKSLRKAQELIHEGKHEEAAEQIIEIGRFGFGYGDEGLYLAALAWAVQFFVDSDESTKAGRLLDSLDALDADTHKRMRMALGELKSVEETGKVLIKLGNAPGKGKLRLAQITRITGLNLDPDDHPASVLATELSRTLDKIRKNFVQGVAAKQNELRLKEQKDNRRRKAARKRLGR